MVKKFTDLLNENLVMVDKAWDEALQTQRALMLKVEALKSVRSEIRSLGRAHELLYGLTEWESDAQNYHVAFVRSFKIDKHNELCGLNAFRDIRIGSVDVPESIRREYCRVNGLAVDEARRAFLHQCNCGGRRVRVIQRWIDDGPPLPTQSLEIGEFCLVCQHYRRRYLDNPSEGFRESNQ